MKCYEKYCESVLKTVPLLICLVFLSSILRAGLAQEKADPSKQLLSKAAEALGGMEKTRGWTTRTASGILHSNWPGWGKLKANCSQFIKKPEKCKVDNDFSAYDHPFFFTYYYNSGDAWMVVNLNVRQNPRIKSNLEKFMETIDGLPYYLAECDTFFHVEVVPDDSLFSGSSLERVGCVHNGDTILFDMNRENYLPVRKIDENGTQHTIFEYYRERYGFKVPFHVSVYRDGSKYSEYIWEEIKFDEKLNDAIFEENRPPAENSPD